MRAEGWESLLARYLEAAYAKPFVWGEHDCALWSAEWVRLCTGHDFTGEWRGHYKTERGAALRMKRLGYANVEAIADAHLLSKPVLIAQRGDLMLHPEGMLGICNGILSHFVGPNGVLTLNTLRCVKSWGIG